MIPEKVSKDIQSRNWYRQGGAILLYYVSPPYRAALKTFAGYNYFKGKTNYGYFDRDVQWKICTRIIRRQAKDKGYLQEKIITPWRERIRKLEHCGTQITAESLRKLTDRQLLTLHRRFIQLRINAWKLGILIEPFDPWGDALLKEQLADVQVKDDDLAVLTAPYTLMFIQRERLHRLKIALSTRQQKDILAELEAHARHYSWIHNSWADVEKLSFDYFKMKVKEDCTHSAEELTEEIQKLESYPEDIQKKKNAVLHRYDLSHQLRNVFHFFSLMSDWRDERKEIALRNNQRADCFLDELVRRTTIPKEDLVNIDAFEVKSIAALEKNKEQIVRRKDGALYYICGTSGSRWFFGEDAEQIKQMLDRRLVQGHEIRGTVANKGLARGVVRIIISSDDFGKMEQGNILVTQMTRPEYTPILKKAAAIVTDEGGITCHAAIVSRELGIPCIIATQVATEVLKDGDHVEVDATIGVVRRSSA